MSLKSDLETLKKNYARGVLKVREGDTWVEFQSMREMRIAIADLEKELSESRPVGSRLVRVSKSS